MSSVNGHNMWGPAPKSPLGGPSLDNFMTRMKHEVGDQPETRERRIRIVRMMLARGNYHVDRDTLAERLLEEAAGDAASRGKAGLDRWPHS